MKRMMVFKGGGFIKTFTLKELLETFHGIEGAKDKRLETDGNFERIGQFSKEWKRYCSEL